MFPPNMHAEERDNISLHELLNQCATDLSARAESGTLNAAYGREDEIEQVLTSLASPLKGRILVTGAARVGKTSLIEEVARRLQQGNCPNALAGSVVWRLSPRSILRAFGVRGWQERLGLMMEKWGDHPEVILYVDALPSTMAAGATMEDPFDMAQFLLGQFQSSNNRLLAEGRLHQVNTFLDTYPEYKHVLLEVRINEPNVDHATKIVRRATADLEASQAVTVEDEAVTIALDVTRRFALHEALPGKAIDLIGESIALRTAEGDAAVSDEDIIARFAEKTGLPRMLLTDDEPFDEELVRRQFNNQVLGQEQAVDIVVQALSLLRTRMNNPARPMGVFLFIGSTGVGKTELARVLSQFLFGGDDVIVRFNMADYTQEWHSRTLFGDPHGYSVESRRGQFTNRLQDRAFAVVLLDEFEKAHPEIYQRFLQLFDEGVLINGASEAINLRNSIVILTSNFGAQMLSAQRIGFGPNASLEEQEQQIREEMVRFFSPEFINRIDSVCFFKPLTKSVLREIAYRRVQEILQREGITRRELHVEVEEDVIEWVVEHGYSERYGARYLARQIEKTITYPLAQQVIRNDPPKGSTVRLFLHHDRVASALSLPVLHGVDETLDEEAAVLTDPHRLPSRISLPHIRAGLPLLVEKVNALEARVDIDEARSQLSDLMRKMSTAAFWSGTTHIQGQLRTMSRLAEQVERVDGIRRNIDELQSMVTTVSETGRLDLLSEAAARYRYVVRELPRLELAQLFDHEWDRAHAVVNIRPKGRRAVARDWALELTEMYLQWAAGRESSAAVIAEDIGRGGSGIWLKVSGYGAFGLLKAEEGIHRLLQTTEDGKRQIVQAEVRIMPDVPAETDLTVTISPAQQEGIRVEGIHLAAVITAPDGDEVLRFGSGLPADELERIAAVVGAHLGEPPDELVRDYERAGEPCVRDRRTGVTSANMDAVLAGDIDRFLRAMLDEESE